MNKVMPTYQRYRSLPLQLNSMNLSFKQLRRIAFAIFRGMFRFGSYKIFNRSQQLIVICLLAQRVRDVNEWEAYFYLCLAGFNVCVCVCARLVIN